MLPDKVSLGWFCGMKARLGVLDAAVNSREVKRVDPAALLEFYSNVLEKRQLNNISDVAIMAYDESNLPFFPEPSRMQAAPSEGGKQSRTRRRVKRKLLSIGLL